MGNRNESLPLNNTVQITKAGCDYAHLRKQVLPKEINFDLSERMILSALTDNKDSPILILNTIQNVKSLW